VEEGKEFLLFRLISFKIRSHLIAAFGRLDTAGRGAGRSACATFVELKCRNSGTAGPRQQLMVGGKSSRMSGLQSRMDLAFGLQHPNERR
jgi:hypothetical protein